MKRPATASRNSSRSGRRPFHRDFWALRDLSFSIRRGEVFCIVGENGSGKSTALQLIAGILQPASGDGARRGTRLRAARTGRGVQSRSSRGRDNVYLNASILGLSKGEIDRRYKAIEEFAEIGDFIRQPVKTYSSGMVVRLAFAVAINVDPEILLVDEALAVGDTYFRHRCMRKVHELRARGITIVFVSHAVADVKAIGDRVLWLEHGRAMAIGDTGYSALRDISPRWRRRKTAPRCRCRPVRLKRAVPAKTIDSIPNWIIATATAARKFSASRS